MGRQDHKLRLTRNWEKFSPGCLLPTPPCQQFFEVVKYQWLSVVSYCPLWVKFKGLVMVLHSQTLGSYRLPSTCRQRLLLDGANAQIMRYNQSVGRCCMCCCWPVSHPRRGAKFYNKLKWNRVLKTIKSAHCGHRLCLYSGFFSFHLNSHFSCSQWTPLLHPSLF